MFLPRSSRIDGAYRALLITVAPMLGVLCHYLVDTRGSLLPPTWSAAAGWTSALSLILGTLLSAQYCVPGRVWMTLSAPLFMASTLGSFRAFPSQALVIALGWLTFLTWLWRLVPSSEPHERATPDRVTVCAHAASGVLISLLMTLAWTPVQHPTHWWACAGSLLVLALYVWHPASRSGLMDWVGRPWRIPLLVGWTALVTAAIAGLVLSTQPLAAALLAGIPVLLVQLRATLRGASREDTFLDSALAVTIADDPARTLFSTFIALGFGGGILLWLPVSSAGPEVTFVDALFTAFSAACVTGLAVLDTPTAWSPFGHVVILALIQVGALGIMAFSTTALALLGRRMSMRQEAAIAELFSNEDRGQLFRMLRWVLGITVVCESAGTLLLGGWFVFVDGMSLGPALWKGLFTSISAFCNAGFALDSDSLMSYAQSPWVLGVVGLLITIGGLGPATVVSLNRWRTTRRLDPAATLVLVTSAGLVAVPAFLIGAMEWNGALGHLGVIDRLTNALFQSVTLRTAGFNSVDFAALRPATLAVMMVAMFVGGSPGSTAGGIKTTAFAVALIQVVATVRGGRALWGSNELGVGTVQRGVAAIAAGMFMVWLVLTALLLTQELAFQAALFETVSAVATVGLSVGATAQLDEIGRLVITAAMLVGRIGPLSLFLLLTTRERRGTLEYPKLELSVG